MLLGLLSLVLRVVLLIVGHISIGSPSRQVIRASNRQAQGVFFHAFARVTHTVCFGCGTIQVFMRSMELIRMAAVSRSPFGVMFDGTICGKAKKVREV